MSNKKSVGRSRTCALAVYVRDHAVIRAVAATVGVLPAEVVKEAVAVWIAAHEPSLDAVVMAVEERLNREKAS
ncbi:MAG: hypothetical protein ACHREM_04305 [Polyangiales bacterium]